MSTSMGIGLVIDGHECTSRHVMAVRVHGMAWALEDVSKGLLLLSSEFRWHLDRDLDKQIAELGGHAMDGHTLALEALDLLWLGDFLACNLNVMAIEVADGLREAEQGLLQSDAQVHVEVLAIALEGLVAFLLEGHNHITRYLARSLLTHARELDLRSVRHAPLDCSLQRGVLSLTLLLGRHALLLLHDHTRAHLTLHHLHLVRAPSARFALGLVLLARATSAAHDAALDARLDLVAVVHVFQAHPKLYVGLLTTVAVLLASASSEESREGVHATTTTLITNTLFHQLHTTSVVKDLLLLVAKHLVRQVDTVHNCRTLDGLIVILDLNLARALVRVVFDGKLTEGFLNLLTLGILVKAQDLIEIKILVS
mmetsp:Transcript_10897/g.22840  ORF Transcript_10897/g.22840 Transcript_10897/m.22840 type:complete len:369 (+) Transcript_10897:371-1477(+)